jgi:hypothetical protein
VGVRRAAATIAAQRLPTPPTPGMIVKLASTVRAGGEGVTSSGRACGNTCCFAGVLPPDRLDKI